MLKLRAVEGAKQQQEQLKTPTLLHKSPPRISFFKVSEEVSLVGIIAYEMVLLSQSGTISGGQSIRADRKTSKFAKKS